MAQSEVTRLLTRIEQEYASARSGLSDLASGTARHAFISGKMERIETCHRALCGLLGEQEATRVVMERIERLRGKALACPLAGWSDEQEPGTLGAQSRRLGKRTRALGA
jgi:hypothetical protein